MPELPEVETTLRGIHPYIDSQTVTKVIIRQPRLRWPVPQKLKKELPNQQVKSVYRRGKYILISFDTGTLLIHLGMSGRLCVLSEDVPHGKHDHVEIHFGNGKYLRLTDPRRFGAVLWTNKPIDEHPLIANIGPEPLTTAFTSDYLWQQSRHKKVVIKTFIMNSQVVAGVGNIYATESLFMAGIHPEKPAGNITQDEAKKLVIAIKKILESAIKKGGTTLKDFTQSDGKPGYFSIALQVYGRDGMPCYRCKTPLSFVKLGQRSTVYCSKCQC